MTFKNKSITEIFNRKVREFSYPNSTSKGLEISIRMEYLLSTIIDYYKGT